MAMGLKFRVTQHRDIETLFSVRAGTRENPISRERLASLGITAESVAAAMASGEVLGWVCEHESTIVGFCNGDGESGEVLVLAVLPDYEGKGVGKRLLAEVMSWLRSRGHTRLWLAADPNPRIRAYGFYRAHGWRSTDERLANGDEILEHRLS